MFCTFDHSPFAVIFSNAHPPEGDPTTGYLKTPACRRGTLSPLSECYSDGCGSLSGLLNLIKICCLQRSHILSQSLSLSLSLSPPLPPFFIFLSLSLLRERIQGMRERGNVNRRKFISGKQKKNSLFRWEESRNSTVLCSQDFKFYWVLWT
jgi:hypothetical protein